MDFSSKNLFSGLLAGTMLCACGVQASSQEKRAQLQSNLLPSRGGKIDPSASIDQKREILKRDKEAQGRYRTSLNTALEQNRNEKYMYKDMLNMERERTRHETRNLRGDLARQQKDFQGKIKFLQEENRHLMEILNKTQAELAEAKARIQELENLY